MDRDQQAAWHRLAPPLGLNGSHLLEYSDTLLGDTMLIDTRGTGKRASQISARDVAERLGEIEMIPVGRIDVDADRIPGRLRHHQADQDPWKHAPAHPATDPDSPYARHVPVPGDLRKPLVIGGDPETGAPLRLTLWDEDEGAKVVLVVAKKGSGKTVLMNCVKEGITRCADARLIQVNLSKPREDRRWAPLAAATPSAWAPTRRGGPGGSCGGSTPRSCHVRGPGAGHVQSGAHPGPPLLVVMIDEVDAAAKDPECKQLLADIASKCRSEGIALIIAGQRATVSWIGGADLRANVDIAVLGRFSRPSEARHATGAEADLPDMGAYGEGAPGVFLVTELGGGGDYDRGRVFKLSEPRDIDAIVAARLAGIRPYVPGAGKAAEAWATIDGDDGEDQAPAPAPGPGRPGAGRADRRGAGTAPPRARRAGRRPGRARRHARHRAGPSSIGSTPRTCPATGARRSWRCSPRRAGRRPGRPPRRSAAATWPSPASCTSGRPRGGPTSAAADPAVAGT